MPVLAREPMALGISTPPGRSMAVVDDFIESIGGDVDPARVPALWSVWSQWGSRGSKSSCVDGFGSCYFPRAMLDELANLGIMSMVWWEPINPAKSFFQNERWARHKKTYKLKRNDDYIREWAQQAKKFGQDQEAKGAKVTKIILRLAHEPNGTWFPWTIGTWDNTGYTFKRFWRHVWRIFRDEGALPYVDFLLSLNKNKCLGCNPFFKVYPGDKYVDYVGLTAFNWGAYKGKGWQSMMKSLELSMKRLWQVAPKKPVIVAELASNFKPTSKSKATWIKVGYNKAYERWGRLWAIMYLNTRQPKIDAGHPDWSLDKPGDGSALEAYATIAAKARFQGDLP